MELGSLNPKHCGGKGGDWTLILRKYSQRAFELVMAAEPDYEAGHREISVLTVKAIPSQ